MPSLLTVDDEPDVRKAISRLVGELGFEIAEARDGVEALATLEECRFDLVILDVMMPNMDGPTTLARMRQGGDRTPVIMLTAESRRPVIATVMKAGISDYVVKPFDHDELSRKIISVLESNGHADVVATSTPGGVAAAGLRDRRAPPRRKRLVDLLVVDDMENVAKRLRSMLPKRVTMCGFTCAQTAIASASDHAYRAVLIDADIPDIDSVVLAQQMRQLQPRAAIAALLMRANAEERAAVLRQQGFRWVLHKPFSQEEVDDFVTSHLDIPELLTRDDNLLILAPLAGDPKRLEGYLGQLARAFPTAMKEVASASHDEVIVDLTRVEARGELLAKLLASAVAHAKKLELTMSVVGTGEVHELLASFEETKGIACFGTVREARAAGS